MSIFKAKVLKQSVELTGRFVKALLKDHPADVQML